MNIVVSVSDAQVSADPADQIVTYSLGSCIGVSAYDPAAQVAGMLHYQLPTSTMDANRAKQNPLMFADTGMACLLAAMERAGAKKNRLKIKLAGGAQILDDKNVFSIGQRNHAAIRKVLWQHGLFIDAEHVGGKVPRTMYLNVKDGAVELRIGGERLAL